MTTSNTDQMREAFEAWMMRPEFNARSDTGKYESAHVDGMWSAWQAALSSSSSGAVLTEYRMFDSQWVNVVNDPSVMNADGADEAVEAAVRLTEKAMAKNIRDGNWPGGAILAATQRAEPVAQSGVEGLIECLDALIGAGTQDGSLQLAQRTFLPQIRAALNAAPPAAAQKCDGNHGGPRCADPECWNDEPAPAAVPVAWISGNTWAEYVAGMVVCYLGCSEEEVGPIAGIIERRLKHLTRPAAPLSEVEIDALLDAYTRACTSSDVAARDAVRVRFRFALMHAPSPSPQPTDEATDAGRAEPDALAVWREVAEAAPAMVAHPRRKFLLLSEEACARLGAALEAARLATPPDNAAGREGV
jgi:hypothetical protein